MDSVKGVFSHVLSDTAVTCAHREYISESIYPDPSLFGVTKFTLLDQLDKSALPSFKQKCQTLVCPLQAGNQ